MTISRQSDACVQQGWEQTSIIDWRLFFFLSLIDDVCFRVRDGIKVSIYGPVFTLNRPDMPFRSDWEYIVHI